MIEGSVNKSFLAYPSIKAYGEHSLAITTLASKHNELIQVLKR